MMTENIQGKWDKKNYRTRSKLADPLTRLNSATEKAIPGNEIYNRVTDLDKDELCKNTYFSWSERLLQ